MMKKFLLIIALGILNGCVFRKSPSTGSLIDGRYRLYEIDGESARLYAFLEFTDSERYIFKLRNPDTIRGVSFLSNLGSYSLDGDHIKFSPDPCDSILKVNWGQSDEETFVTVVLANFPFSTINRDSEPVGFLEIKFDQGEWRPISAWNNPAEFVFPLKDIPLGASRFQIRFTGVVLQVTRSDYRQYQGVGLKTASINVDSLRPFIRMELNFDWNFELCDETVLSGHQDRDRLTIHYGDSTLTLQRDNENRPFPGWVHW